MNIFLDSSVLLAACGSAAGASRAVIDAAAVQGWSLLTSAYVIAEVEANLAELPSGASDSWAQIRAKLAVLRDADRGDDWAEFAVQDTPEAALLRPLKPFPPTRVDEVFGSAARRGRAMSLAQMDAAVAAGKAKRGLKLLAKARGDAAREVRKESRRRKR